MQWLAPYLWVYDTSLESLSFAYYHDCLHELFLLLDSYYCSLPTSYISTLLWLKYNNAELSPSHFCIVMEVLVSRSLIKVAVVTALHRYIHFLVPKWRSNISPMNDENRIAYGAVRYNQPNQWAVYCTVAASWQCCCRPALRLFDSH